MNKCNITFYPENKSIAIEKGTTIMEAARQLSQTLNPALKQVQGLGFQGIQSVCGGDGVCGKCRVIIKKGRVESEPTGLLKPEEQSAGVVLACSSRVFEDIEVEIPPESRAESGEILLAAKKRLDLYSPVEVIEAASPASAQREEKIFHHSPLATKVFLKLPPPSPQDTVSDLERIYRELKRSHNYDISLIQTGLANIKKLGGFLRENNWEVTVTLGKRNGTTEMVIIEPGNTSGKNYGVAVDVGTTTVVTYLIDLASEKTLGMMGTFNKQISYGDDIITRIIFASEKEGLEKLHLAVTGNINNLISSLAKEHQVELNDITAVMVAGNTTMIHLLLNIDPTHRRMAPHTPTAASVPVIRSAETGIRINPRGLLACVPNVSSYVGGDVAAGILTSGMTEKDELAMYIDMGTNGEIVLGNKDWVACCACSAGPAFEGSGIKSGTRAIKGAIQKIEISPEDYEPKLHTIGKAKPRGICGSGLVELLAEMNKVGIMDRAGKTSRIKTNRVRKGDEGLEYVLAWAKDSETGRDIVITQADIDNIIRSKAAVFAGCRTLLKKMGYTCQDVQKFYIAGAFGNYLDIKKSIAIGMLPDLPAERFQYIGNGSIAGARMILLSYTAMDKANQIADKMTYIELSDDNIFHEEFVSAMFLPHTDLKLFPSLIR